MNVEKAIRQLIIGDVACLAIVGDRVFPNVLPQDQKIYPAMVYQRISGGDDYHLTGASGLTSPRIQVRLWHPEYKSAKDGIDVLRRFLSGYSGTVTVGTDVFVISPIIVEDGGDVYDEQMKVHGATIDLIAWHGSGS